MIIERLSHLLRNLEPEIPGPTGQLIGTTLVLTCNLFLVCNLSLWFFIVGEIRSDERIERSDFETMPITAIKCDEELFAFPVCGVLAGQFGKAGNE